MRSLAVAYIADLDSSMIMSFYLRRSLKKVDGISGLYVDGILYHLESHLEEQGNLSVKY